MRFTFAWLRRLPREERQRRLRAPGTVLAFCAGILLLVVLLSGGLRGTRALLAPPPYRDPKQLFLFAETFLGQPFGSGLRNIAAWQGQAKLSSMAGFASSGPRAWVTPSFFELLGTTALIGRVFSPQDSVSGQPLAVLSYELWSSRYGGDPGILGRRIVFQDQPELVIGVLPRGFRVISKDVAVWTLLDLSGRSGPPAAIGVGRIRNNASRSSVRNELLHIAERRGGLPPTGARFALLPIEDRWTVPVFVYGAAVFFALALAFVALQASGLALSGRFRRSAPWRAWGYFLLKTGLALAALGLASIELTAAVRLHKEGFLRDLVTGVFFSWLFLLGCTAVLCWSVLDQRRRCPVCLRRVSLPFSIGSWSSALEPVSTEFLCDQGHGALSQPETHSSASEPRHWTSTDDSLRGLFEPRIDTKERD